MALDTDGLNNKMAEKQPVKAWHVILFYMMCKADTLFYNDVKAKVLLWLRLSLWVCSNSL